MPEFDASTPELDADELFHEGEREVQRRAGVADIALRVGRGAMQPAIDLDTAVFLSQRLFVVAGAQAPDGNVWASLLVGAPGFARTMDAEHLRLAVMPAPGDPLQTALDDGPVRLGLLALEPATRTRVRLNGTAVATEAGILVTIDQVFGNCTKYIGVRVPMALIGEGRTDPARASGTHLTEPQRALLRQTDTAFVASAHPERGADASHRGGRPGFLTVDDAGRTVLLPDYKGNRMFQTLGNLTVDPRVGMLVVDWDTGLTLQLAGVAEILWSGPEVDSRPDVDRVVVIRVESAVEQARALPVRYELRQAHPLNPQLPDGPAAAGETQG